MNWCLNKQFVDKFRQGLINKDIDPIKIADLSSSERRVFLEKYVGKENAQQVNALFESKLLLKNQKAGYISWAKRVGGMTKETRRDLFSKIERLDIALDPKSEKLFLEDLATTRLGFGIKADEAKVIFDLSKKIEETKAKMKPDFTFPTENDRLAHGLAQVNFENLVNELKLKSSKIYFKEQPLRYLAQPITATPGLLKSLLSSFDDSFFGRQGIKTLLNPFTTHVWVKDFLRSFRDIGRELKGTDGMALIKADLYSRPNALNGKYKALGRDSGLGVLSEEAYPSSLPERIPIFNRLYKASQTAYNGGALRMRADLADRLIKIAEKQGINVLDKRQGEGIGSLIGSLTGRGSLGKGEGLAKSANAVFFSIKFLKSNFDTLTMHQLDSKATAFTKSQARKNMLSMIGTIAGVLTIAKTLDPSSVEEDPRSTNFGKVKVFGRWVDITGGMAGMVTLASRLSPSVHNGEWGFWTKTQSGYRKLNAIGYGKETALDTAENFLEGKFSPGLGLVRDLWKGQTYAGELVDINEPSTLKNLALGATTPITIQTFQQMMKDPSSSNVLASMILEEIGFSGSAVTYPTNWNSSTSKELLQFKEKVGSEKFKEANERYNRMYSDWFNKVSQSPNYEELSDEGKQDVITKSKDAIKQKVFKEYDFKYKTQKKDKSEKSTIKGLLPK